MEVHVVGYNHFHDADFNIDRPEGSGDYLFLLIKSNAVFHFKDREQIAQPNSFILFKKDSPQNYTSYGSGFSNDFFHFSMTEDDVKWLQNLKIPYDKLVPLDNIHEFSTLINQICSINYSPSLYREELLDYYLRIFFLSLSNMLLSPREEPKNIPNYLKLSLIHNKIYTMPYLDWNVNWFAHELTMSKSTFNTLYKRVYGTTAMADVINSRIECSKYKLSTTNISVKQIALLCGYKNETHFMRQFKQMTCITPSEYREKYH